MRKVLFILLGVALMVSPVYAAQGVDCAMVQTTDTIIEGNHYIPAGTPGKVAGVWFDGEMVRVNVLFSGFAYRMDPALRMEDVIVAFRADQVRSVCAAPPTVTINLVGSVLN